MEGLYPHCAGLDVHKETVAGSRRIHLPERVAQEVELSSGTLQMRVFSSLTVSFSFPMISHSRCEASSVLPFRHRITR
jgi:hypothetical protein